MKRQTRPFTVEVKQKRRYQNGRDSIWGDVDLSAATAEATRHFQDTPLQGSGLIDSTVTAVDAEYLHQPRAEHLMPNPVEAEPAQVTTEPAVRVATVGTKKRAPRTQKAKAEPFKPARKNGTGTRSQPEATAVTKTRIGRKTYSEKERSQKLAQIEKSIARGDTLRSAVKEAGITEQTYYHWKKAAAGASNGGDLKDLVALEEENKRLKGLLAERLRKENAELKKRLGLE